MSETKNSKNNRATKTASGNKSAKSRNPFKKRWVRISIAALMVVITIAGMVLIVMFAADAFFFRNEHFTLRHIMVKSPGWWNGRSEKVGSILELTVNRDNLFSIDLGKKRMALEAVPSIGQVAIKRVLPDTLVIEIIGKIPRAVLYNRRSKWLINDSGIVMDRDNCVNISRELPVIYGLNLNRALKAGMELKNASQALELTVLVLRYHHEIKLLTINVRDPKFMDIKLLYGSNRGVYSVKMPKKDLSFMMIKLKDALRQARLAGEKKRIVNMTYSGKVIFSERR
jgi:cell division septal protein FtsQ